MNPEFNLPVNNGGVQLNRYGSGLPVVGTWIRDRDGRRVCLVPAVVDEGLERHLARVEFLVCALNYGLDKEQNRRKG